MAMNVHKQSNLDMYRRVLSFKVKLVPLSFIARRNTLQKFSDGPPSNEKPKTPNISTISKKMEVVEVHCAVRIQ